MVSNVIVMFNLILIFRQSRKGREGQSQMGKCENIVGPTDYIVNCSLQKKELANNFLGYMFVFKTLIYCQQKYLNGYYSRVNFQSYELNNLIGRRILKKSKNTHFYSKSHIKENPKTSNFFLGQHPSRFCYAL
jgi:hypothetical protein